MKVLAGDWRPDSPVAMKRTFTGRPRALVLSRGLLSYDKMPLEKIESMEVVTEENRTSIAGKAAWGVAGGLLLGGVGALAGLLGGGNRKEVLLAVRFSDHRRVLLLCKHKEYQEIYAAQFGKTVAR